MRPVGKYVLILQDEVPVEETKPVRNSEGGLITNPEEILLEARKLLRESAIPAEDIGLSQIKIEKKIASKPNTGVLINLGQDVNTKEFTGGDRVEFAEHNFRRLKYFFNGEETEFLLMHQDYILMNLSKD